ncbi:glycosyltransferase family 4 protein [Pseudomonas serboccidentalis]|uniref:Glycosyltransferase family 4 protein n=1 Tax=Pseudomonas serboccidentalis TaxID=2964670 RepID=A0ABY7Z3Z2_9PSED|nr:glycosyltransferase family 4 protein [Pseudomonas serboccidentalis]WDR34137.1 glycosyltransferase family 4 protein [Pseudomonas serboccidentalis]
MIFCWLSIVVLCISLALTWALRHYALNASMLDVPNERSSHTVPTPRGGGVAIVVSFIAVLPILVGFDSLTLSEAAAVGGAGLFVAILGFADDHGHIAAVWRLLGHFIAAAWLLFWLNGFAPILLFSHVLDLGWAGPVFGAMYLVWLLNLYNFMDGIDGLASVEAICVCLGMCIIYYVAGAPELFGAPLLLSAAVMGFLFWNFPPAKIFMGDAGSGFLGIAIGGLSLVSAWHSPHFLWCWLILLGVFVVDATFTLFRRVARGEKIYQAHCSHAYQNASRYFKSHRFVTLAVLAINLLWLLPIAVLVAVNVLDGVVGILLAYSPIAVLAWRFGAGSASPQ